MKKQKLLIDILQRLFVGAFIIMSLSLFVRIGFDLFTDDGRLGSFSITEHHSQGYSIPINVSLSIPDSTLSYKEPKGSSGAISYYHDMKILNKHNKRYEKRANKPGVIKTLKETKIVPYNNEKDNILAATSIRTKGQLVIKNPDSYINYLQGVNSYLTSIMIVLILYQLQYIFFKLKDNLSFSNALARRVNWLGIILIINEIIQLVISYVVAKYYQGFMIEHYENGHLQLERMVKIRTRLDFDSTLFFTGLSLLVLCSLLKMGTSLKQENELTI